MARKKRPGSPPPKTDTRRRSEPATNAERRDTTAADLGSELNAERERIGLQGFLTRRWIRQAVSSVDKQVGLKFYYDDYQEGFKMSRSIKMDAKIEQQLMKMWGETKEKQPIIKVWSQYAQVYEKERGLDGKPKTSTITPAKPAKK